MLEFAPKEPWEARAKRRRPAGSAGCRARALHVGHVSRPGPASLITSPIRARNPTTGSFRVVTSPTQHPLEYLWALQRTDPINHTKPWGASGRPVSPVWHQLTVRTWPRRYSSWSCTREKWLQPTVILKAITSSPPHFHRGSRTLPCKAAPPRACSVVQGREGWLAKA